MTTDDDTLSLLDGIRSIISTRRYLTQVQQRSSRGSLVSAASCIRNRLCAKKENQEIGSSAFISLLEEVKLDYQDATDLNHP
ncbi:unnamed protein product [Rhizophagus irregularis]|nr:unnamed protein product [Rhizophagus irregularis]